MKLLFSQARVCETTLALSRLLRANRNGLAVESPIFLGCEMTSTEMFCESPEHRPRIVLIARTAQPSRNGLAIEMRVSYARTSGNEEAMPGRRAMKTMKLSETAPVIR
jgi:hypothetical protein